MNKRILAWLQMALGVAIVAVLVWRMPNRQALLDTLRDAGANRRFLAGGMGLFGICMLLCALRWDVLLRAQGLRLPFGRILTLYFVGHFFNSFLPGATSGDVVKACFAARETAHRRTEIVSTVFIDRLLGLAGLLLLAAVITAFRFRFFMAHPATRVGLLFNLGLLSAFVLSLLAVVRRDAFLRAQWLRRLTARTGIGAVVERAYTALRSCIRDTSVLVQTVLLSMLNHVVLVFSAFLFGMGLNVPVGWLDYLTVFPIINAIAAVPVTPGGLGTREAAATVLLGALDVPASQAVPLSLLLYASMFVWSLVGGIVYVCYAYRTGLRAAPPPANSRPGCDDAF